MWSTLKPGHTVRTHQVTLVIRTYRYLKHLGIKVLTYHIFYVIYGNLNKYKLESS